MMLPDDWTPFMDDITHRDECYWCGAPAKYRFYRGDILACNQCWATAGPELVAFTEVYR